MKCVVVTDWNAWDYDNIIDARKQYRKLVNYCLKYGNKDGPQGTPSEYVVLWRADCYYNDWGFPIEQFDNDATSRAAYLKTQNKRRKRK